MANGSDKCANCGGERGIHHYQTDQCPVGGAEAPIGKTQAWKASTFQAEIPFDLPSRLASSMTLREHFAAMAMQGILAGRLVPTPQEIICQGAVEHADELIAKLNSPSDKSCGHCRDDHAIENCPHTKEEAADVPA